MSEQRSRSCTWCWWLNAISLFIMVVRFLEITEITCGTNTMTCLNEATRRLVIRRCEQIPANRFIWERFTCRYGTRHEIKRRSGHQLSIIFDLVCDSHTGLICLATERMWWVIENARNEICVTNIDNALANRKREIGNSSIWPILRNRQYRDLV